MVGKIRITVWDIKRDKKLIKIFIKSNIQGKIRILLFFFWWRIRILLCHDYFYLFILCLNTFFFCFYSRSCFLSLSLHSFISFRCLLIVHISLSISKGEIKFVTKIYRIWLKITKDVKINAMLLLAMFCIEWVFTQHDWN